MLRARLILASLGLAFLAIISLGVNAQDAKTTPQGNKDDIITAEQQLARQFGDFVDSLIRLKQRLQRGTPEEQKRAKILGEVIDECRNLGINQEFSKMIEILKGMKGTTGDFQEAVGQSDRLATALATILARMRNSQVTDLSAERKKLQDILKELGKVIEKQEIVQAQIHQDKTDKKELKGNQNSVSKATDKIKDSIDKYLDKAGEGKEAANQKGDIKNGGKEDGAKGEAKNDGKNPEGAKGEAKNEGDDKNKGPKGETKPGEKAEAKSGAKGKEGDPQAGAKTDKTGAKGQEGNAKGNDKGDKKEGSAKGDPMKGDPQGSAKGDDKKGGDKQAGPDSQAKAADPKAGAPKEAGAKESKGGDKGSEAKAGGDPKGGDSKQGDAKAGDSKDGQGQAKAGGEAGDPKSGGQPPQAGQKGDNGPPPPPGNKQNDEVAKSNQKIKEAGYDQKSAEDNIPKDKQAAGKNAADAADKLKAAQKQLEKLLQQMREEELERVLAALQARCEKMLMMQQQVLVGTEDLHKVIQKNIDKKATRENKLASMTLSDKEKEIVLEANKCIDILEAEGSAVAFPEVFQQIRQDMIHVQKRLELTDTADVTQGIERDIIDTLKEMIDALKKARQDNQDSQSKPGEPGKGGPPQDQKLLELIQELKMVRSLQKRVNDRTTTYGKRFPGQEQMNDVQVIRELRSLAERQLRIQEIVSRISKGENK